MTLQNKEKHKSTIVSISCVLRIVHAKGTRPRNQTSKRASPHVKTPRNAPKCSRRKRHKKTVRRAMRLAFQASLVWILLQVVFLPNFEVTLLWVWSQLTWEKWVEIPFLDIKLFPQRNRAWVATTCWLLEKVSVVSHVMHHMVTDRWPDNHWLLGRSWRIQVLQKVAKYKLLPVELLASAFNTSVSYRYVQIISMFQGVICVALFW